MKPEEMDKKNADSLAEIAKYLRRLVLLEQMKELYNEVTRRPLLAEYKVAKQAHDDAVINLRRCEGRPKDTAEEQATVLAEAKEEKRKAFEALYAFEKKHPIIAGALEADTE
ncbi:hypothetical protein [Komagataeibacter europaeus]|uniref:hypothetical protein n=1 Tax=Komagataeibacter europaeus TaxID=33995 RepID=UPI00030A2929|nr:hypothetical protein [Komagataeibacter europaeus]GBQ42019.1 hypothetical protein AA18890_1376 [Komagataeibacter europaeus LMG 18890]